MSDKSLRGRSQQLDAEARALENAAAVNGREATALLAVSKRLAAMTSRFDEFLSLIYEDK